MVGYPLRDRRRTSQGVRAVISPSGIVPAGVVVGVALALGAPLVVAVPLAVVAWAGGAAWRGRRPARRGERIDPFTLQDPWRRFVQQALQARRRLDVSLREVPPGPLADRLHDVGGRIHAALHESWLVAKRGQTLSDARGRIDVRRVDRKLADLRRGPAGNVDDRSLASGPGRQDALPRPEPAAPHEAADPAEAVEPQHEPGALEAGDPGVAGLVQSLEAQKATAARLDQVIARAEGELQLLDARMNEAVARVVELSTTSAPATTVGALGSDIDGLVTELEALRRALDEAYGPELGELS